MKKYFFLIVAAFMFATGCQQRPSLSFTQEELLILNRSDSVMYLTVVTDRADSLILRNVSRDFTDQELQSKEFQTLARNLLATVQDPSQDGVGIAAPQVGLNLRMLALMRYAKEGKPIEAYANVHILDLSASKKKGPEGCLSIPNYRGEVSRSDSIVVSYYDINTRTYRTDTVTGYTAVIFQHETDHLEGILYTDRADTVYFNQRWAEERKQYEQEGAYTKPGWWPYK